MLSEYRTDGPGKFEGQPPMARFLYERVILHGFSDESTSDGQGDWLDRIGRRLVGGDSYGFVFYSKLDTVDDAAREFRRIAEQYEVDDGHGFEVDHDPDGEHGFQV